MTDARAPEPPLPAVLGASFVRAGAFVVVNVALVAVYLEWLVRALPPLGAEGRELVVVPVSAIAFFAFAGMVPALRRARTHAGRLAVLGAGIALGVTVYTGFVLGRLVHAEPSSAASILFGAFVVFAQLLYGAPLFVAIALLNKLLSPLWLARPVRAWV